MGGATGGKSAIGNESRLTPPASVMTIEITDAKIGRWMKNREITAIGYPAEAAAQPQKKSGANQSGVELLQPLAEETPPPIGLPQTSSAVEPLPPPGNQSP